MITDMPIHPKIASGRFGVDAEAAGELGLSPRTSCNPSPPCPVFWSLDVSYPDWLFF